MATASLAAIVRHADRLLRHAEICDYDGAHNGLQAENRGNVTRIAAAVDASLATIRLAIKARADLLIVHHGLFWAARHPWTGVNYELLRALLENDLAVYSSHLPLDAHPKLGNNTRLCAALGLRNLQPFFLSKGQPIGFQAKTNVSREELTRQLRRAVKGEVKLLPGGPRACRRVGVVSGGAGNELTQAATEGVDTFITGEGSHWTYGVAEDLGINVLYAGHYATETFGVKALAEDLSRKFRVPWTFVDHPTGL